MSPWMVGCSSVLLNLCEVSRGGFTAYLRRKGKDGAVKRICFGETLAFWRKPLPNQLSRVTSPWEDGVYLGMRIDRGRNGGEYP